MPHHSRRARSAPWRVTKEAPVAGNSRVTRRAMADDLAGRVLSGEIRAIARLMRNIDDRVPGHREDLRRLFPATGKAHIIGITGNPGVGKSTLVDRLVESL